MPAVRPPLTSSARRFATLCTGCDLASRSRTCAHRHGQPRLAASSARSTRRRVAELFAVRARPARRARRPSSPDWSLTDLLGTSARVVYALSEALVPDEPVDSPAERRRVLRRADDEALIAAPLRDVPSRAHHSARALTRCRVFAGRSSAVHLGVEHRGRPLRSRTASTIHESVPTPACQGRDRAGRGGSPRRASSTAPWPADAADCGPPSRDAVTRRSGAGRRAAGAQTSASRSRVRSSSAGNADVGALSRQARRDCARQSTVGFSATPQAPIREGRSSAVVDLGLERRSASRIEFDGLVKYAGHEPYAYRDDPGRRGVRREQSARTTAQTALRVMVRIIWRESDDPSWSCDGESCRPSTLRVATGRLTDHETSRPAWTRSAQIRRCQCADVARCARGHKVCADPAARRAASWGWAAASAL